MHIYISGIGGAGLGPLAMLAIEAGYQVSGSDKQITSYTKLLQETTNAAIHIGQDKDQIADVHSRQPIDWFVHTSALTMEQANPPELLFCNEHDIKVSKRDELLNTIINDNELKLLAIAGTHGKTTTTAMLIWLLKSLGLQLSYALPAKVPFGPIAQFGGQGSYFVYEADEYDKNFLEFSPNLSLIIGVAYDHPDIYPTQDSYNQAFTQFINQSQQSIIWQEDTNVVGSNDDQLVITAGDIPTNLQLLGLVNRRNAWQAIQAAGQLPEVTASLDELVDIMNKFPGLSRRFEEITSGIYSDYAHTPEKIRGALQTAHEAADERPITVVYEGLHNNRQHFIKDQLPKLFEGVDKLYVVPSYLAREDESLEQLTSEKLCEIIQTPSERIPSQLDDSLKEAITAEKTSGNLVLCLSAGGGGSLDEWLRKNF